MTETIFRSDMTVDLIDSMGGDQRTTQAARASTKGAASLETQESEGLINFLSRDRHGVPTEHTVFTFYIEAPIFVWRELRTHRHTSVSEESGRYKKLSPTFYIPDDQRPLVQTGKAAAYTFTPGTKAQTEAVQTIHQRTAEIAYAGYEALLEIGVAREVARMSLPLNIYSSAYMTINSRSLMNLLSLRIRRDPAVDGSKFPSFPMLEIEMVAKQMEAYFKEVSPIGHSTWARHGFVSP